MEVLSRSIFLFSALLSASCTQLPVSGPAPYDIVHQAAVTTSELGPNSAEYALVDLSVEVTQHAVDIAPGSFFKSFGEDEGHTPKVTVGKGDVLQLTIFELKSGGLFIPAEAGVRPGNFVQVGPLPVGPSGDIEVPYAGEVRVVGRTLKEIQVDIKRKLETKAIEPKVVASFVEQNAATVSIIGEVNTPKKVKLTDNGERILDVIALAGGIRFPGYDTFVSLQRGTHKQTIYFSTLMNRREENIYTSPGDVIYVYREPRRFIVFGAVNSGTPSGFVSQQFNFDQEHLSLAEAVAKSGGLADDRANPGMIFVYRVEPREVLQLMGVSLDGFLPKQSAIPTVYRANFRDPGAYFSAQSFPIRDKDIIYVSNAESVEVTKALMYAGTISSTVAGVALNAASTKAAGQYIATGNAKLLSLP